METAFFASCNFFFCHGFRGQEYKQPFNNTMGAAWEENCIRQGKTYPVGPMNITLCNYVRAVARDRQWSLLLSVSVYLAHVLYTGDKPQTCLQKGKTTVIVHKSFALHRIEDEPLAILIMEWTIGCQLCLVVVRQAGRPLWWPAFSAPCFDSQTMTAVSLYLL